jgi:mono/diheme cytochrome c family protein
MMMPAKGGNPALSQINLQEIVAYIRTINADQPAIAQPPVGTVPTQIASAPIESTPLTADATPVAVGTPAFIHGELNLSGMSAEEAYLWSCVGCHGSNGEGMPNIGPSLAGSDLLDTTNGIALFDYLASGRPFADPRVTFPHLARGGYPPLSDEQIRSLIAYLYTLEP